MLLWAIPGKYCLQAQNVYCENRKKMAWVKHFNKSARVNEKKLNLTPHTSVAFASTSQACVCKRCTHRHVYREEAKILGKNSFLHRVCKCILFAYIIRTKNKHCLWPYTPPATCNRKDDIVTQNSWAILCNMGKAAWPATASFQDVNFVAASLFQLNYWLHNTQMCTICIWQCTYRWKVLCLYHKYVSPHYDTPAARSIPEVQSPAHKFSLRHCTIMALFAQRQPHSGQQQMTSTADT